MTDSLGASQSTNLSACDIASPSHGNAFTLQEGWRVLALHFLLTMQTNSEWCVGFLLISFQQKGKGLLIKMPFVFYRKSCPFSYGWRISLLKLGLLFFLCSDLRVTSCILLFSTYKPPQVKHSQVYIIQWLKYFQHKILSGYFLQNIPQICNCGIPWQCEISAYMEVCTDRALHLSVLGRGCFLRRLLCRCRYVCRVAHRRQ